MRRASWLGPHAPFAFAVASFVLAVPALTLPMLTLSKFGNRHESFLLSGPDALWRHALFSLSALVLLCAMLAPIAVTAALLASRLRVLASIRGRLGRALEIIEYWAMPEIYLLGILVALVKLDSLVDVSVDPGLWCFAGMTIATLCAWWSDRAQFGGRRHATRLQVPETQAWRNGA